MKVKHLFSFIFIFAVCIAVNGCGGTDLFGRNSLVIVRLDSGNTNDIAISVSPNSGDFGSSGACSDFRSQSWCFFRDGITRKDFEFTTSVSQVPYFIWASNQTGSTKSGTLIIIVDGVEQLRLPINVPAGIDIHYATMFRNNVETR
jgi:hypothetical protein